MYIICKCKQYHQHNPLLRLLRLGDAVRSSVDLFSDGPRLVKCAATEPGSGLPAMEWVAHHTTWGVLCEYWFVRSHMYMYFYIGYMPMTMLCYCCELACAVEKSNNKINHNKTSKTKKSYIFVLFLVNGTKQLS